MSCIEGNHHLFTAMNILGFVDNIVPPKKTKKKLKTPDLSEKICIIQEQNLEVVTLLEKNISEQILSGVKISRKFIQDKNILITSDWSDWFQKICCELEEKCDYMTMVQMRSDKYCNKGTKKV